METKITTELESYVAKDDIKNPKIKIINYQIYIDTIPINFNLIADYIALILCIYLTFTMDNYSDYLFLKVVLWFLILLKMWRDFRYVNYLVIDLKEKEIKVISKNFIKRAFAGRTNYTFEEVNYFFDNEINLFNGVPRHTIRLKTKNGAALEITDFSEQKHAFSITKYLNLILNKK